MLSTALIIKPTQNLISKWHIDDRINILFLGDSDNDAAASTQLCQENPTIEYNNRNMYSDADVRLFVTKNMGSFHPDESNDLQIKFNSKQQSDPESGYSSEWVEWERTGEHFSKGYVSASKPTDSFISGGVKYYIVWKKYDEAGSKCVVELGIDDLPYKNLQTNSELENKPPIKSATTDPTRVKAYALRKPYHIWISECNASEYEGNAAITPSTPRVWIEMQGSRSHGSPDVYGTVYDTSGNRIIQFSADNSAFSTPWFEFKSNSGQTYHKDMQQNENWVVKIDNINYKVIREPDGDGCKLFQLYVDA